MTYKYLILGNDVTIFRVGDVPEHGISIQDFKHPMIFWQYIEESCTYQKIYMVLKRLNFRQTPAHTNVDVVEKKLLNVITP